MHDSWVSNVSRTVWESIPTGLTVSAIGDRKRSAPRVKASAAAGRWLWEICGLGDWYYRRATVMQVIEKAVAIFFKTGRFCEEIAGFSVAPDIFHLTAPGGQSELFFEGDVGEVASARRRGPFVHGSAVG